jgi:hypothetical protein
MEERGIVASPSRCAEHLLTYGTKWPAWRLSAPAAEPMLSKRSVSGLRSQAGPAVLGLGRLPAIVVVSMKPSYALLVPALVANSVEMWHLRWALCAAGSFTTMPSDSWPGMATKAWPARTHRSRTWSFPRVDPPPAAEPLRPRIDRSSLSPLPLWAVGPDGWTDGRAQAIHPSPRGQSVGRVSS